MFTGIIESKGTIRSIEDLNGDRRITIDTDDLDTDDISIGDSIAVNGVCITVVKLEDNAFSADLSSETLSCTSFSNLKAGRRVNLEKAMQLGDRLHGHIVSGHVDAVGRIKSREEEARSVRFTIELPVSLLRYVSRKGSVCIDGVSLTVNEKYSHGFMVNIIPHTLEQTIFPDYVPGDSVNIEVDLIARYLESLLEKD